MKKIVLIAAIIIVITNVPPIKWVAGYDDISYSNANGSFTFDTNGWLLKPNGLFLYNHWGTEGLAALLPDNFDAYSKEDFLLKMDVPELEPLNKRSRNPQKMPEKINLPQKPLPVTTQ